jgi:hypothetical protein
MEPRPSPIGGRRVFTASCSCYVRHLKKPTEITIFFTASAKMDVCATVRSSGDHVIIVGLLHDPAVTQLLFEWPEFIRSSVTLHFL